MVTLASIAGNTIAGAGAGISELTALAVTSELGPTRKRGTYVAGSRTDLHYSPRPFLHRYMLN